MFKLIQDGEVHGDCTASYIVELDKDYTVQEFIQEILTRKEEWGYIGFSDGHTTVLNPSCEFRYGKLLFTLPDEIRNKKVVFARANGGWSNMDYQITMNLEKE